MRGQGGVAGDALDDIFELELAVAVARPLAEHAVGLAGGLNALAGIGLEQAQAQLVECSGDAPRRTAQLRHQSAHTHADQLGLLEVAAAEALAVE